MALTRELLKSFEIEGLTDAVIQQIMDAHGETVTKNKESFDETQKQLNKQIEELKKRPEMSVDDVTALNTQVKELSDKLKAYEKVDVESLNTQLAETQAKLSTMEAEHATKVAELELDGQIRERLAAITFSSDYARTGIYNDIKGKVKIEDNKLTGFDEAIEELKTKQPKAFVEEQAPPPKKEGAGHGGNPPPKAPESLREAIYDELTQKK